MTRGTFALVVTLASGQAPAQEPIGLERLFVPGYLLEDRNGDGVIDFVNAELHLPEDPSPAIVAAAAEVAARLGFETLAMNLPLTRERGGVRIRFVSGAADLRPGEGRIEATQDAVTLSGADDVGVPAAAIVFAGRLPHIWDPQGLTVEDVSRLAASLRVSAMQVRANGVSRLELAGELESVDDRAEAEGSLREASAFEQVEEVVIRLRTPEGASELRFSPASGETRDGPIASRPAAREKRDLDLSSLYTKDGLLGDSDQNLIIDRIDAVLSPAGAAVGTVDLAARLALEAAGVSIPLTKLPDEIGEDDPTWVLIGDHPAVDHDEKLMPGEGMIQVVRDDAKASLIIRGGDDAGLERALAQAAVRLPHIWRRGKDRTTLDDVELDLWRFLSARSPAGQAATALYKLDRLVSRLSAKRLRSARVLVSLEKPAPGFEAIVRERALALGAGQLEVVIDDRDVQHAATIFEEQFELRSEVEEFWRLFQERVRPRARNRAIRVEARLSEPREVRRSLEEKARTLLLENGARRADVSVLSAYKQGYSWIEETLRPRLQGEALGGVTIRFARYAPPEEWPQQAMHTPLRWLHEIFPIDEILARDLDLPLESVHFEMAPEGSPAYEVVARSATGNELWRESFDPKLVLRPYLDRFRDYEMVNVTTGWISATAGEDVLLDQRIPTDAERFWDHFQESTLARIYDYVMQRHDGEPRGDGKDAPYFGELNVRLELSEPHEVLGIDQEILSPMDALHEDVYFTTLMFFRILGRNARGEELTYPGRVIPVMLPKSDGLAGRAEVRLTGFATSRPAVLVEYEESSGETSQARLDIPKVELDRPQALAARVEAGVDGITRLDVRVKVDTETDERDELLKNARAELIDERILSAEQVVAMIEHLDQMRASGVYAHALAYHELSELRLAAAWKHELSAESERVAVLSSNGQPKPLPDIQRYRSVSEPTVQWQAPMPPSEAYGILAAMSAFEEATVYRIGESYLGKDVWAMDLMPPLEASHFSHHKATTLKPTVIYSARQHANEVSSTSHVLRLAQLLLTDPDQRKKLDTVNVVIHPITNPDGAELAYDLYRETPDFLLHAGYYASLGMDVTSDSTRPMPIYPEAAVRPALWQQWLPDIFLNPHGYPSHQLVQLFSEYTGLVRRGRITERNWSMNKGWFMPGFAYIDDARYPRHKAAAFAIRDYITKAIRDTEEVNAMNQRSYDRYFRYGGAFDDDVFKLPMVNDVMIHTAIKGDRAPAPGSEDGFHPKVTIWSGTTEAPDETARGHWLELVAKAGLAWDLAILQYLVDGNHQVERERSAFWGGVSWSLDRPRPPKLANK